MPGSATDGAGGRPPGGTDLAALVAGMRPTLHPGAYVFATVAPTTPLQGIRALATFDEAEGRTLVLREDDAAAAGIAGVYRCAWITLEVHSALEAVGFLARVAACLAAAGISCNPVSAVHHDHLFVPYERGADAVARLEELAATAAASDPPG